MTQAEVEDRAHLWGGFMTYLETKRLKRLPMPDVLLDLCRVLDFTRAEMLELAGHAMGEDDLAYLESKLRRRKAA